jgi:hypothetical protein
MTSGTANFLRVSAAGNYTLSPPPFTPSDGEIVEVWTTATGGSLSVTLGASIYVPFPADDPLVIAQGTTYIFRLRYDALNSRWQGIFLDGPW